MQALLLPVGADRFALELTAVREVVLDPAMTPLPGAPPAVLGVLNLRGEVVPVLDTAALLGVGRLARVAFAAVAETALGLAALGADAEPATAALHGAVGPGDHPAAVTRFPLGGGLVTLLDPETLLAPEHIAA